MTAPLIFMDTETTGLALDDDIWEFAAIRREPNGIETELHLFIDHDPQKAALLPPAFFEDITRRYSFGTAVPRTEAAHRIWSFTTPLGEEDERPHIVGAVPNFDTERLALLLGRHGFKPGWHHHLVDVENLAVGWLAGQRAANNGTTDLPPLPWDSDDLSRAVGIEPPTTERHTAMGDARWAMALYDHIVGGGRDA